MPDLSTNEPLHHKTSTPAKSATSKPAGKTVSKYAGKTGVEKVYSRRIVVQIKGSDPARKQPLSDPSDRAASGEALGDLLWKAASEDLFDVAYRPDARAAAILRGISMTEGLLIAAGGTFDLGQVQTLFRGISRQAIDKRVQDGTLLAVPGPGNSRVYPTIQFQTDGSLLSGLKQVQEALPSRSPWAVLAFLMTPQSDLGPDNAGQRPIDLLHAGDLELVLQAARGMGVQGS